MSELADVIERVEAATEGSRELDRDICIALGWHQVETNVGLDWRTPCGQSRMIPHLTTSLDAVMSLVGDRPFIVAHAGQWAEHMPNAGKPIFEAVIPDDTADYEITMIGDMIEIGPSASAATPALALLAAILRARQTEERG